nr:MBL fold metallo-hydrolase [Candidatus Brachybacter algidus]
MFNPFQENTYILYDDSKECIIIDPGCYTIDEQDLLKQYISSYGLTPVRLINTHCHIDHILGNNFVFKTYGLLPSIMLRSNISWMQWIISVRCMTSTWILLQHLKDILKQERRSTLVIAN